MRAAIEMVACALKVAGARNISILLLLGGECYGQLEESSTACPSVQVFQAAAFTVCFL